MKRKSLLFEKPHRVCVVEEPLPSASPREVMIESCYSAISAGTEMLVFRGWFPDRMEVDAAITEYRKPFAYPIKYGYCLVGRIRQVGDAVDRHLLGKNVFCFHPHESHFTIDVTDVITIPAEIDLQTALFYPHVETALTLVMDGRPVIGENVAVFGQGVVGLLTTALLGRFPLNGLLALDPFKQRRQAAVTMGANAALDPFHTAWHRQCADFMRARSRSSESTADLIYELSGNPAAVNQALALCGFDSRLVIGSWYGARPVTLDLGGSFHRNRVQVISSQVSTVAPIASGRWNKRRRRSVVWNLIRRLNPRQLITHCLPIERAGEAFDRLQHSPDQVLQIIFSYGQ